MVEYVGELVDDDECKRRIREAHAKNNRCYYMLTLDTKRFALMLTLFLLPYYIMPIDQLQIFHFELL